MASKRKFKRDYIILEAKDMNFRYKERVAPKAFAKVEVNDEKSTVALYVENVKSVKDGYKVVAIRSDYDTVELGNIVIGDQGNGEFAFDLENSGSEIKGIAMLYEKTVPLIGFKGSKIDNYEEILFMGDDNYEEDEYEDSDEDEYEYEEIEYIEIDEDDPDYERYEEIEYIEIDEDNPDYDKYEDGEEYHEYEEIDNYEEIYNEDDIDSDSKPNYNPEPIDSIIQNEIEEEIENIIEHTRKKVPENNNGIGNALKNSTQSKSSKSTQIKSSSNQSSYSHRYIQNENIEEIKSAGTLLMPRQIKKGLKMFKEVKPFVNEPTQDTRWWKIEVTPTTLCGYTMPNLGYINTLNYTMYSDIVMNSYKYRHYLFGVQYDEYNKRKNYIYAIPGAKNEQPDKGLTGFRTYQPCDNRSDNLGYWLCIIDSRTRRIIK